MMLNRLKIFTINIFRKAKFNLLKIYHARGSSHEIALGAAIGSFWGVFPTFGLSTILSLLLYKLFRFNLIVALAAAFISNPITSPFLLMISYKVGTYFVDTNIKFEFENWYRDISKIAYVLFLGATIVSSLTAIIIYFITKYAIEHRQGVKTRKQLTLKT